MELKPSELWWSEHTVWFCFQVRSKPEDTCFSYCRLGTARTPETWSKKPCNCSSYVTFMPRKAGISQEQTPKRHYPVPPSDFQPGQPTQVPRPEIRQSSRIPSWQVYQQAGHGLTPELDVAAALSDVLTPNLCKVWFPCVESGSCPNRCSEDPPPQEACSERWKIAHKWLPGSDLQKRWSQCNFCHPQLKAKGPSPLL